MRGLLAFARKEALEIPRTWRIWVLPGILLFFAVTGPVLARYTPEIIGAVGGSQFAGIELPEPTYLDSYGQWVKNVSGIAFWALIVIYAGIVSSEMKSGTAVLVLTKPVSRAAFVVAKALVHMAFLAVTVAIGTAITWAGTVVMFGEAPPEALVTATVAWTAFGVLFIAVMTGASAITGSQGAAAGIGFALYAVVSIAALSEKAGEYSPVGLVSAPALLAAGKDVPVLWPLVTSLALAVLIVAVAALAFRRKEL